MKTNRCFLVLILGLSVRWACAAPDAKPSAETSALLAKGRQGRERLKVLDAASEKAVAALKADLAGAWTSVIVAHVYDCSCTGPSYRGFCLKREGGALTVEAWSEDKGKSPVGVSRVITPPEVERLLSETALFYLAAVLSVSPREKAGPMPSDPAKAKEWFERLAADGEGMGGSDQIGMEVRVATPEGVKRHSSVWALDAPKDFYQWLTASGNLR